MKINYILPAFILALFMLVSGVSAQYDCTQDQLILSLATLANTHGEAYSMYGNYPVQICYDEIFGRAYNGATPNTCSGNNLVLRFASQTNAHAQIPSLNTYTQSACYGDLQCRSTTSDCAANEKLVVSLASDTNSHLSATDSYPTNICCSSANAVCNNDNVCNGAENVLTCASDCAPIPATCGNNLLNLGEACDGNNFGALSCSSFGYTGGNLACSANCLQISTASCTSNNNNSICGNGVAEAGEACDNPDYRALTCPSFGFASGLLSCGNSCTQINTASCSNNPATCGNSLIEPPEVCDSANFGALSCSSYGFTSGTLGCLNSCGLISISSCIATNNTLVISNVTTNPQLPFTNNGGEQNVSVNFTSSVFPIDVTFNLYNYLNVIADTQGPTTLNSASELPIIYTLPAGLPTGIYTLYMTVEDSLGNIVTIKLGTITVNPNANLCGNGLLDSGEVCDINQFSGDSCTAHGFLFGTLSCVNSCQTISTSTCFNDGNDDDDNDNDNDNDEEKENKVLPDYSQDTGSASSGGLFSSGSISSKTKNLLNGETFSSLITKYGKYLVGLLILLILFIILLMLLVARKAAASRRRNQQKKKMFDDTKKIKSSVKK
ncbi:MAG: hypothetical protein Q8L29_02250 [archaeon]|nr:hypothetical protein [archaeon]